MKDLNQFPEFKKSSEPKGKQDFKKKVIAFYEEKIANDKYFLKLKGYFQEDENAFGGLSGVKKKKNLFEKVNLALTIVLLMTLIFSWKTIPPMLANADQLRNDLLEQNKIIEMEEKNNKSLKEFDNKRNELQRNINIVYSVIPSADEKAEEIISMLETIGSKCRITFDSIGIRKIPETQFFYDDLLDVVQPFEYTLSIESGLPNILSFMELIRSSLRLMDIMSIEIEEAKGGNYKATMSIYTYHNIDEAEL